MERRKFLKSSALLSGLYVLNPMDLLASSKGKNKSQSQDKAKNIIFMVSDGMSLGTLTMTDLYARNILGKSTNWMNLYLENKVSRALMDTASASSIVTDSSAASSAFGGGIRVKNGRLNVGENGEKYLPIWQEWKKKGKKAGCLTTVTITHATPAGFCINSTSRNAEPEIAKMYAEIGFDVLMGGGQEYFEAKLRKDQEDVYKLYQEKNYQIIRNKSEMNLIKKNQPLLGIFNQGALPYSIDANKNKQAQNIPSLAEMTQVAIDQMKDHKEGFVLQIEAGKVDWAAHANDVSAIIHEQLAFDQAIKTVMNFAEKDENTLVIITTDHGNANPGIIYDSEATRKFNSIANYTSSNEYLLNEIHPDFTIQQIKDIIHHLHQIDITEQEAKDLQKFYTGLEKEEGLYNYKKLPYKFYAEIQKKHNSVGWISMDHSSDYVELAAFGPGSHQIKSFIKNTDVHQIMQKALA